MHTYHEALARERARELQQCARRSHRPGTSERRYWRVALQSRRHRGSR